MSRERREQSFARTLQRALRAEHRRVARQQLGVCGICGTAIAEHFEHASNRFVPCERISQEAR